MTISVTLFFYTYLITIAENEAFLKSKIALHYFIKPAASSQIAKPEEMGGKEGIMGSIIDYLKARKEKRRLQYKADYEQKLAELGKHAARHYELEAKGWGEDKPFWTAERGVIIR